MRLTPLALYGNTSKAIKIFVIQFQLSVLGMWLTPLPPYGNTSKASADVCNLISLRLY
jgi:hypothetical protein